MRLHDQAANTSASSRSADTELARAGLRVQLHTRAAGQIELKALSEHRLMIHASTPVSGLCRNARFVYTRGEIDVVPAGDADSWHLDDNSDSLVLQLAPSLLRRAADDMGLNPDRASLAPRHQIRDPRIEHIAWALDAERRDAQPSGGLYAESLGLALAVHMLGNFRASTAAARVRRGLSKQQLRRVLEYIDAHIDRDLSLLKLAEVAGVSASHLKNAFRVSSGLPVHEFVIRRRVERAKEMLVRGGVPASQVALDAGFSHQSHMARWMKRVLGVTPRELARGVR